LPEPARPANGDNPIYWSDQDDPEYAITNICCCPRPPQFASVRIPHGATPEPDLRFRDDRLRPIEANCQWISSSRLRQSERRVECGDTNYDLVSKVFMAAWGRGGQAGPGAGYGLISRLARLVRETSSACGRTTHPPRPQPVACLETQPKERSSAASWMDIQSAPTSRLTCDEH
jgi:hypothetical protein